MAKPSSPERRERLAAALRENLKRRKAHKKEAEKPSQPPDSSPHDAPDDARVTLSGRGPTR